MTGCFWCGSPVSEQLEDWPTDLYCSRECAKAAAHDLGLIASEDDDDDLVEVQADLVYDAMLDAMQDRMREWSL